MARKKTGMEELAAELIDKKFQKKTETKGLTLFIPVEQHDVLLAIARETGQPKTRIAMSILQKGVFELAINLELGDIFADEDGQPEFILKPSLKEKGAV